MSVKAWRPRGEKEEEDPMHHPPCMTAIKERTKMCACSEKKGTYKQRKWSKTETAKWSRDKEESSFPSLLSPSSNFLLFDSPRLVMDLIRIIYAESTHQRRWELASFLSSGTMRLKLNYDNSHLLSSRLLDPLHYFRGTELTPSPAPLIASGFWPFRPNSSSLRVLPIGRRAIVN